MELPHLVVSERPVGKLHVDVPRGVGHHHGKLPEDGDVQEADIAADPLHKETQSLLILLSSPHLPPSSHLSLPHLRGEQFALGVVDVPSTQAQLRASTLEPHEPPLCLWRAVDLIVDVFAGVHVEARVEEGAVAQALVRVLVDDATVEKTCVTK